MMREKRNWTEEDMKLQNQAIALTARLHGLFCPDCGSTEFSKSGKAKGNQRYKCKTCGRHFRSTSGNSIHHLHLKPKIQAYIDCMGQGLSLRKTAAKVGISLNTAFRWKHRFLEAVESDPEQHPNQIGISMAVFSHHREITDKIIKD